MPHERVQRVPDNNRVQVGEGEVQRDSLREGEHASPEGLAYVCLNLLGDETS